MTLIRTILALWILSVGVFAKASPEWILQTEKDGIRIYTKDIEGTKFKQVRGVTQVNLPKVKVIEILTDFDHYHSWNDHITESEKISSEDDTTHLVYTMEDAPWPVQDRYHVSKFTVSRNAAECTIKFESIPDFLEKRQDAIELKRQSGYWKITSEQEGSCTVEFFMDRHPGGYVPAWLVNYLIVETPFNTLQNLHRVIAHQPRP